jgi:hypothetical protein
MHLPHAGAAVQQSVVVGGGSEHADHHLGDVAVSGGFYTVHEVECGVGGGAVAGSLRAHHNDGHGRVLHHVRQRGRGVMHGVGAVTDDDAAHALLDFLADAPARIMYCSGPMFSLNTPNSFVGLEIADVGKFGHRAV